jgi:hypothetical protein
VSAPTVPHLGELAEGVDVTEILPPVCIHDDCGFKSWGIGVIPKEELLSVTPERDFDQMGHRFNIEYFTGGDN